MPKEEEFPFDQFPWKLMHKDGKDGKEKTYSMDEVFDRLKEKYEEDDE